MSAPQKYAQKFKTWKMYEFMTNIIELASWFHSFWHFFPTCQVRAAPLNLNLQPAQLSVHRWTSTWDLPSSVCTAGPQRPDRMPEDMPDRMSDIMPEDMPDKMP